MKKLIVIISLVLAAAIAAGCTASASGGRESGLNTPLPGPTKVPLAGPIEPSDLGSTIDISKAVPALYWDVMRVGGGSGETSYSYAVFTDHASLAKAFEGRELPARFDERSFDDVFVVAVYLTAPTGGWTYELKEGSVISGRAEISINAVRPSGPATQAFERSVMLIAFDRSLLVNGLLVNVNVPGFVTGAKTK